MSGSTITVDEVRALVDRLEELGVELDLMGQGVRVAAPPGLLLDDVRWRLGVQRAQVRLERMRGLYAAGGGREASTGPHAHVGSGPG